MLIIQLHFYSKTMNWLSASTKSILRSLKTSSEGFKKKEEVCEIPWISIDCDQKLQKLISGSSTYTLSKKAMNLLTFDSVVSKKIAWFRKG